MVSSLSAGQLQYILDRARRDGRLSEKVINGYLAELQEEICDLEVRLHLLRGAAGAGPSVRSVKPQNGRRAPRVVAAKRTAPKRSGRASAKNTTSQQVQGRYIAYLRQLPVKRRPKYQELARTQSRETAIDAMKKALGK